MEGEIRPGREQGRGRATATEGDGVRAAGVGEYRHHVRELARRARSPQASGESGKGSGRRGAERGVRSGEEGSLRARVRLGHRGRAGTRRDARDVRAVAVGARAGASQGLAQALAGRGSPARAPPGHRRRGLPEQPPWRRKTRKSSKTSWW